MKRGTPHVWGELSEKATDADTVEFCSLCGCPVVVAEGAMDGHRRRIHVPQAPARPMPNLRRWEMEWRT